MTNNSWNSTIPVEETKGGTNQSTYTTGDILYASASNTLSKLAVGTNGQTLTVSSSIPTWSTAGITGPGSSTDNALARWDGTTGTLLQNSTVIVSDNGEMTNASQPAFLAYLNSTDANVTGDGTTYVLGDTSIGNTLTELFDQNADFTPGASGGAYFTAPVTGKYFFHTEIGFDGISTRNCYVELYSSNRPYRFITTTGAMRVGGTNFLWVCGYTYVDMDASDIVQIYINASGSTKATSVYATGGGALLDSYVGGYLEC
jgi:hypothetical protein